MPKVLPVPTGGAPRGRSRRVATTLAEINVIPLVDVMLVLLIIFMITAPILQSGIEVSLPKTKTVREITEDRLVVTIDRAQRVYLGNEPVNVRELARKIRAQTREAEPVVYMRSDETVPFGAWAAVVDAMAQGGIKQVSVVTEPISSRAR